MEALDNLYDSNVSAFKPNWWWILICLRSELYTNVEGLVQQISEEEMNRAS